jgi:hypothetical protein
MALMSFAQDPERQKRMVEHFWHATTGLRCGLHASMAFALEAMLIEYEEAKEKAPPDRAPA